MSTKINKVTNREEIASHDVYPLPHDAYGHIHGSNGTMVHQKSSVDNYQTISASCELKFY